MVAITSTGPSTFGSTWRQHDAERREPDQAGGGDVFLVLLHHRRAAHGARVLDPEAQADGEDQHGQRASPRLRAGAPRATTPSTSSAIRMAGNVSCTSATRMMTASTAPPT